MGGEGAMMAATMSLKNNNRRRKNHSPFKNNRGSYGRAKPKYDLPSASPELLIQIKEKVKKQQRRRFKINMILFALSVMTILAFFKFVI